MNAADVKNLNAEELAAKLAESANELFKLRLQAKTGQLENSSRVRLLRRTIARIKTEQTARAK